jgi:hypothetical protein
MNANVRPLVIVAILACAAARGEDARPIQDNSFLVEEAYNQEPGVIQHVSLFTRERDTGNWVYSFTEEWPAYGQAHQASVTVQAVRSDARGAPETGFGDVLLNYRWQAVGSGDEPVAVSPRASLILPSGDWRRGLGAGGPGAQVNLPVSSMLGERFVGHFNLGATWLPRARSLDGDGTSLGVHLGQGLIWLAHPNVNLMLEAVFSAAELDTDPGTVRSESFLVSPGLRGALDLPFGLQVVGGIAVPVGFGPSSGSRGILGYLSFEHAITRDGAE